MLTALADLAVATHLHLTPEPCWVASAMAGFAESSLTASSWEVPQIGRICLEEAASCHWQEVDRDWPPLRSVSHDNQHLFTLGLIAARALELNCAGLVLGALPSLVPWYQSAGGAAGKVFGWKHPPDLIPFRFAQEALLYLKELTDEFLSED